MGIDPHKICVMGFSATAELVAPAAILYEKFDRANNDPGDPLRGISSRPDFGVLIYPGPTPFPAIRARSFPETLRPRS